MRFYVNHISADHWSGVQNDEEAIESPSVNDLFRLIKVLNAKDRTLLCLGGQHGSYMAIGGGNRQYVVYISDSNQQLWNLIAEGAEAKLAETLIVGGQDGDYPARQIVGEEIATKAAESFFLKGERDPSLQWELQK